MQKWVPIQKWDEGKLQGVGQIEIKKIPKVLNSFRKAAATILKESGPIMCCMKKILHQKERNLLAPVVFATDE